MVLRILPSLLHSFYISHCFICMALRILSSFLHGFFISLSFIGMVFRILLSFLLCLFITLCFTYMVFGVLSSLFHIIFHVVKSHSLCFWWHCCIIISIFTVCIPLYILQMSLKSVAFDVSFSCNCLYILFVNFLLCCCVLNISV